MSRIGKKPITIPQGVTVAIREGELEVKGAKGVLKTPIPEGITFKQDNDELVATRGSDNQAALHGLARALANNAIKGVTCHLYKSPSPRDAHESRKTSYA
jgi:large subunit ribosomal protein L6